MPMSPSRRNVVVGLTVLAAIVILAGMLLKFGGPTIKLFHSGHSVQVHLTGDRADGLAEGAQVTYLGQSVGRVLRVDAGPGQRVDPDRRRGRQHAAPARQRRGPDPRRQPDRRYGRPVPGTDGGTAKPEGTLADGQTMRAKYVGTELLPPAISALADQLNNAHFVMNLNDRVREGGDVLRGLRDYVDDAKTKADVKAAIDNFRHVSEVATVAADNVQRFSGNLDAVQSNANATVTTARAEIERVSRQLDDRMLQVAKLLDHAQSIAAKADHGPGTASLLVNDPKLYQSLVDNSRELTVTINDLKRLVEQWEQEGISFKLK